LMKERGELAITGPHNMRDAKRRSE